jgi:hypothetical protein
VAGTLGVGFVSVFSDGTIPPSSNTSFIAVCPAGTRVLSGGGGHRDSNAAQQDITVNYSGPDDAAPETTWLVRLTNRGTQSRAVRVRCNCARIQ